MPTVSNGAPTNAALEGRWWRTSASNLTSLSSIVLHPPTFILLLHHFQLSTSAHYLDFCWQTDSHLHGSDHYPIVITTDTHSPPFAQPTLKLQKADWAAFSHQAALELYTDTICRADNNHNTHDDIYSAVIYGASHMREFTVVPLGQSRSAPGGHQLLGQAANLTFESACRLI